MRSLESNVDTKMNSIEEKIGKIQEIRDDLNIIDTTVMELVDQVQKVEE